MQYEAYSRQRMYCRVSRQARTREPQCSLVTMLSQLLLCKPMFVGSCYSKYSQHMKQFSGSLQGFASCTGRTSCKRY
eukprot:16045-Heterococcus_DN1.PRE.2